MDNQIFSINGLPWSHELIDNAASQIKQNGSIGFAFGFEKIEYLFQLNTNVFAKRPDLRLQVWTVADNKCYRPEELNALASLNHVRKLEISSPKKIQSFAPLAQLNQLEDLILHKNVLDLDFLNKLKQLKTLQLRSNIENFQALNDCSTLKKLYVGGFKNNINDLLKSIPNHLSSLTVDASTYPTNLAIINRKNLKELHLSSLNSITELNALADFSHLKIFKLHSAPHLKYLPLLSKMSALTELELQGLKSWENPEILQTLPHIETITLKEINPKLKAERLAFLTTLPHLKKIDFRFIDFGKRRQIQLEKIFSHSGKIEYVVSTPNH